VNSGRLDYDEIGRFYDEVREADERLIDHIRRRLPDAEGLRVLEIGCGTGNYADLFQRKMMARGWRVHGTDPAQGMLERARAKNSNLVLRPGSAESIPWEDASFDFVYMTAVVQHVSDIRQMFSECERVLAPLGLLCIATQTHEQIARRPMGKYFPGTTLVDLQRYPRVEHLEAAAIAAGLQLELQETLLEGELTELGEAYLELVRKKGYSRLRLIEQLEYEKGLAALEDAMVSGPIHVSLPGETLLWFRRTAATG